MPKSTGPLNRDPSGGHGGNSFLCARDGRDLAPSVAFRDSCSYSETLRSASPRRQRAHVRWHFGNSAPTRLELGRDFLRDRLRYRPFCCFRVATNRPADPVSKADMHDTHRRSSRCNVDGAVGSSEPSHGEVFPPQTERYFHLRPRGHSCQELIRHRDVRADCPDVRGRCRRGGFPKTRLPPTPLPAKETCGTSPPTPRRRASSISFSTQAFRTLTAARLLGKRDDAQNRRGPRRCLHRCRARMAGRATWSATVGSTRSARRCFARP